MHAQARRNRSSGAVGDVDFTMMYAAHDAFRRDLQRMTRAVAAGKADDPAVRAGWQTFENQLVNHHNAEDQAIWPQLRDRVREPGEAAVLDQMEAEHARIDPLLAAIDDALAHHRPNLAALVDDADRILREHMDHEEDSALPLIAQHLGSKGWNRFQSYIRREYGLSGAAEFLPWILDGLPSIERAAVLRQLPAPARLLYRRVFEPRYARAGRWGGFA
ncbi:hemerythrin domain-containing protein [Nocardia sp. BSTN01]|nr:hemerythrin domain-containing protein [Nocardia sp. BSTN01]